MTNDMEARKSPVKSWLFDWLSKLETYNNIIGEKTEMGNIEKVTLIFNTPDPPTPYEEKK